MPRVRCATRPVTCGFACRLGRRVGAFTAACALCGPRSGEGSALARGRWGRSKVGPVGVDVAGLGGRVGHGGVAFLVAGAASSPTMAN